MYMHIHDTHMYTHILNKYWSRKNFMTGSFIFNIQKRFLMTESFVFLIKEIFTTYFVSSLPANQY